MRGCSSKTNNKRPKLNQPNMEQDERELQFSRTGDGNDARRQGRGDGSSRQCGACGCAVPSSGWEQHVNGIRHRRNQASVTLTGEPGHIVRSIFEPDPADIPTTYRGKDPVALRAQQMRRLLASPGEDVAGRAGQEQRRQLAPAAAAAAPLPRQPQAQQPMGAAAVQPTGGRDNLHPPRAAQRRRSHSEAFAELQAARQQRLLGEGGAAAAPLPPAPADSSASDSGSETSETSSSSDASSSDPDSNCAAGARRRSLAVPVPVPVEIDWGLRNRPSFLTRAAHSSLAPLPQPRRRQPAWSPDEAQVSGLVAAARREAVHHTGVGPLYQAALGLLDAGALRRGVSELDDRLRRYRRRLEAWLQLQQQRDGQGKAPEPRRGEQVTGEGVTAAAAAAARDPAVVNAGGGGVGSRRSGDSESDSDESSSSGGSGGGGGRSESGGESSSGTEGLSAPTRGDSARAAAGMAGRQQQQQQQASLRRPYLRLGPAELLLLSIHPAVAATRGSSSSETKMASRGGSGQAAGGGGSSRRPDPSLAWASAAASTSGGGARHSQGPPRGNAATFTPAGHRQQYRQPGGHPPGVIRGAIRRDDALSGARPVGSGGGGGGQTQPRPLVPQQPQPQPLRELYLEVPFKLHGREAAAYATAMGVLLAALRRTSREPGGGGGGGGCLEAFGLRFSREDYMEVLSQGGAARMAPLESLWQLVPALVQLLQARPGTLRELRLCCPPGLMDVEQMECLQRAAVDPQLRNQRRLAVLMGAHARLGAISPLLSLPREVVELVLDLALPRRLCRLVLGVRKWMPGTTQQQGQRQRRRRAAAAHGAGAADGAAADAAAAVWAVPGPEQQQQQPVGPWPALPAAAGLGAAAAGLGAAAQQQLPLDVRVAARHAARR